jgi:hypothetical protein
MKQDRFLLGILIGIGALAALALALFFVRRGNAPAYGSDDTPEGVVRNYVLAVFRRDYEKAYGYLADKEDKPTLEQFREAFLDDRASNIGVDIVVAEIRGDHEKAYVTLHLRFGGRDPFSYDHRDSVRAILVNQGGQWKIEEMPYQFWGYNWYQPAPTPSKP